MRFALPLLLLACGDSVSQSQGEIAFDGDADGYTEDVDCDDTAAEISPGAPEICDGIDNDCDELVDDEDPDVEGLGEWFLDNDGDGYGDPGAPVYACERPDSATSDARDCDDANIDVHPEADEICATVTDDNCDGSLDEGATDCTDWLADADGDGFGGDDAACRCTAGDGYTSLLDGDCDDADPAIHPDAIEVCNDGVDQDCDGAWAECRYGGEAALDDWGGRLYGAATSAAAGAAVSAAGDTDGDGIDDLVIGAPGMGGGAVYLVRPPVNGGLELIDAPATFTSSAGTAQVGPGAGVGDLDGDGLAEVSVGEAYFGSGGRTVVFAGPQSGVLDLGDADVELLGGPGAALGVPAPGGDLNGDGAADLLIGATGSAAVYALTGPVTASAGIDDVAHRIAGVGNTGEILLGVGDTDGDGLDDLLMTASNGGTGGLGWLLLGPATATTVTDAEATLETTSSGAGLGTSAAALGDIDGDGYADVGLGAPDLSASGVSSGGAFLVLGPVSGPTVVDDLPHRVQGVGTRDAAGTALTAGDLDGDGWLDLAIGAPGMDDGGSGAGAVALWYGPFSGVLDFDSADVRLDGPSADDAAGSSLAIVPSPLDSGPLSGGLMDLLVGVPGDDDTATDAGMVVLVNGQGG